jgi:hypothetical protein
VGPFLIHPGLGVRSEPEARLRRGLATRAVGGRLAGAVMLDQWIVGRRLLRDDRVGDPASAGDG